VAAASNLYIGSFAGLATPLTGLTSIITITIVRAISDDAVDRDDYRGPSPVLSPRSSSELPSGSIIG